MKKNSERSAAMRFTMKLSILLTPFIALLVVYFLNDPFMVLRHYNRYDNSPVMLNEGYIGWQMYMNNRVERLKFTWKQENLVEVEMELKNQLTGYDFLSVRIIECYNLSQNDIETEPGS